MFSLEDRKNHTKYLTEITCNFLFKITQNNALSGFYLLLIHWITTLVSLVYIIIGDINIYFYISCLIWISVFINHFYFAGCICTIIECKLWNTKDWLGPWLFYFKPLELTGIEITTNLANNIFICFGICIASIGFLKILYNMKN